MIGDDERARVRVNQLFLSWRTVNKEIRRAPDQLSDMISGKSITNMQERKNERIQHA